MKVQFTPGPWEAWTAGDEIRPSDTHVIVAVINGVPVGIAEVPITSINGADDLPCYKVGAAESIANLNLLAKAPELYGALKDMLEHFATAPENRDCTSYKLTNKQIAANARALLREIEGE